MILYHYTTAIGLQGIIQDRAIWASDYRFTNDAKEFLHGLEIFQEVLKSYRPTPRMSEIVDIIRDYKPRLDFCVLLASFCIDPDLLSQWRGYNGGAGYALGIDGDWLEQNAQKQGFHLVPVSYVPEEQKRVALQKLELLRKLADSHALRELEEHILLTMTALKNEKFEEEREYRLVKITHTLPAEICTRPSTQGLIPYVPFKLDATIIDNPQYNHNNFGIERIVIGFALHHEHQRAAVRALFTSHGMEVEEDSIEVSKVPYRSIR